MKEHRQYSCGATITLPPPPSPLPPLPPLLCKVKETYINNKEPKQFLWVSNTCLMKNEKPSKLVFLNGTVSKCII